MPKCCVCGRGASIFAQGKWWCEKHFEPVDGELRELPSSEGQDSDEKQSDTNLELKEV